MRTLPILLALAVLGAPYVGATTCRASSRTLRMNADGTYENGYSWLMGSPGADYCAFAERYEGGWKIESIVVDLTALWGSDVCSATLYVWDDDGGVPGIVLQRLDNLPMSAPGWPLVARYSIPLDEPLGLDDGWWIGFLDVFLGELFVAADLDGPGGGVSMTNVPPGQGYPTGWQDVSIRWGPTAALGLGTEGEVWTPTPAAPSTWGAVKALFR